MWEQKKEEMYILRGNHFKPLWIEIREARVVWARENVFGFEERVNAVRLLYSPTVRLIVASHHKTSRY